MYNYLLIQENICTNNLGTGSKGRKIIVADRYGFKRIETCNKTPQQLFNRWHSKCISIKRFMCNQNPYYVDQDSISVNVIHLLGCILGK